MGSNEASYPYIPFHISCLLKNKKDCKDVYCILNSFKKNILLKYFNSSIVMTNLKIDQIKILE